MSLIFLLSHERSGSHLLAGYLKNFGILSTDEVCNNQQSDAPRDPTQFSAFLEARAAEDRKFLYRTWQGMEELMQDYCDVLIRRFGPGQSVLVDVKYGHLHNFNSYWNMPGWTPNLIEFIRKAGHKIIHLHRQDHCSAIISNHIAHLRQLWNQPGEKDPNQSEGELANVRIEKREFFRWVWALTQSIRAIRWTLHFNGIPHCELVYEDIRPSSLGRDTARRLCEYLGLDESDMSKFVPKTAKMTLRPEQIVANYDELRALWEQELQPLAAEEIAGPAWVTLARKHGLL